MMNNIIKKTSIHELAEATKSPATKMAYKSDLKIFDEWCRSRDLDTLPTTPEILVAYIIDRSDEGSAISTIARAVSAISQAHKLAGLNNPVDDHVREALKGLRRLRGIAQRRARPLEFGQLVRIMKKLSASVMDRRNAAILALGWSCALRRSEIVGLNRDDIESVTEGIKIHLRRSKTDQEGAGRLIGIPFASDSAPFCPVDTILRWTNIAGGDAKDPVFFGLTKLARKAYLPRQEYAVPKIKKRLGDRTVVRIIKESLSMAGYDNVGYSGHSLRSGFCTSAARRGVPEYKIMEHTGHKSSRTMRGYIREGSLFRPENPLNEIYGIKSRSDT